MAVITKELLAAINTNINVTFQDRFKNAQGADDWKKIAMPMNSKGSSEKYAWLGAVPGMREFKSERIPGTLSKFEYEVDNLKFESTLDVDRVAIEDDQTGQLMLAVNGLGTKAGKHYSKLSAQALDLGFSSAIFDGQNFFDADHQGGSNYLGSSKELTGDNYEAAAELLSLQVDNDGEVLGHQASAIIVGPKLRVKASKVVNSRLISDGAGGAVDNPHYKVAEVVVMPFLGSSTNWFVADLTQGILPLIMQIRVAIKLLAKTDLNSDRAFDKDIFTWGTRGRHNVGYGNHQLIVGAKTGA